MICCLRRKSTGNCLGMHAGALSRHQFLLVPYIVSLLLPLRRPIDGNTHKWRFIPSACYYWLALTHREALKDWRLGLVSCLTKIDKQIIRR